MIQGLQQEQQGQERSVDPSPEEKWQNIQEGLERKRLGDVPPSRFAANLFYRRKDEAKQSEGSAWKSAATAETEKDNRIRQLERTLGRKSLEIEILNTSLGVSCGAVPSQAREVVPQGFTATLLAAKLSISWSSSIIGSSRGRAKRSGNTTNRS
jgi:hypothetical protein